jgi:hypothetical protein
MNYREFFFSFLFSWIFVITNAQKPIQDSTKNKLPYTKYAGLTVFYVALTPSVVYNSANSNYTVALFTRPRIGYYVTPKTQILGEYIFGFQYFRTTIPVNTKFWHQFGVSTRFFPFKKWNLLFAEAGIQTGSYTIARNFTTINKWSTNYIFGFGFEALPKKRKHLISFDYRIVLPVGSSYLPYRTLSLGFGLTLKKNK